MTSLPVRLPATENTLPTTPFSKRWLASLRRGMGTQNGKPILMQGFSISPAQHREITAALFSFRQALIAGVADRPLVGIELGKLLAAFPTQDPGLAAGLRVDAYREAIDDAPAWAVREARLRVIRGQVEGLRKDFAPTPPQLVAIIDDIVRPLRADLADLESLTKIEPKAEASPEQRAAMANKIDGFRDELAANTARRRGRPRRTRQEDEAALRDRLKANGADPTTLDAVPTTSAANAGNVDSPAGG